jgi:hypothetical protein
MVYSPHLIFNTLLFGTGNLFQIILIRVYISEYYLSSDGSQSDCSKGGKTGTIGRKAESKEAE